MSADSKIVEASAILASRGFPAEQTNERSALALLALIDLRPDAKKLSYTELTLSGLW